MKFLSLYRVELRRLSLSKFTWVIGFLSLCTPMLGYSIYITTSPLPMTGKYIANPVLAGTVMGAILWSVLTMLEMDRVYRTKTDILMDSISSPILMAISRILSLITLSTVTMLLTALTYLPYTINKVNYLFDIKLYSYSFLIIMMPTWWISILLAGALYQITRRLELTGLLYTGCAYLSVSQYYSKDYFPHWLNPIIVSYSDGFSNAFPLRITLYTRVLWLAFSGGIFTLSLLCLRRYEKKLIGSLVRGIRKLYLPVISASLLCTWILLWKWQPFVNHAPLEFDLSHSSSNYSTSAMATSARFRIIASPSGQIHGIATYTINKFKDYNEIDSIWLDPGYKILSITCNNVDLDFETLNNDINDQRQTTFTLPKGTGLTLVIEYKGMPKLLRCFTPFSWDNNSSADYVSLNNASSVPCNTSFFNYVEAFVQLVLPEKLTPVIEERLLSDATDNGDGTKTWNTRVSFGQYIKIKACDYATIQFEAAGATIDLVYSKKYDENMKRYKIPEAIASVMEYCTTHQGSLSFIKENKLMMLQSSSTGGDGGNAGKGYVEWSEYIFTDNNLNDPLKGAGADEVFAHEIIHQWWGGLGVECGFEDTWSSEGMTVYTTYRLMKEKYGALYAKQNYIDVWQAAVDAQNRSYYYRHPESLDKLPEKYQVQLSMQALEINQYCRMPLMILKAEQLVGGEDKFDDILKFIQQNYAQSGMIFTYQDFLAACNLREEDLTLE